MELQSQDCRLIKKGLRLLGKILLMLVMKIMRGEK